MEQPLDVGATLCTLLGNLKERMHRGAKHTTNGLFAREQNLGVAPR